MPRHLFVPDASLKDAYANATVSIKDDADGTSISSASQPAVVGLMLEQLQPEEGEKILELGAGTGYNAGLLARLVGDSGHVTTIDVDDDLVDGARAHLEPRASTTSPSCSATARSATPTALLTTGSSPPSAPTASRTPGWTSSPTAAASSYPCACAAASAAPSPLSGTATSCAASTAR